MVDQIQENKDFFKDTHCVVITDVVNPDQGKLGLTTSLCTVVQMDVTVNVERELRAMDEQTALYKLLATLIREDHSLGVEEVASASRFIPA